MGVGLGVQGLGFGDGIRTKDYTADAFIKSKMFSYLAMKKEPAARLARKPKRRDLDGFLLGLEFREWGEKPSCNPISHLYKPKHPKSFTMLHCCGKLLGPCLFVPVWLRQEAKSCKRSFSLNPK